MSDTFEGQQIPQSWISSSVRLPAIIHPFG